MKRGTIYLLTVIIAGLALTACSNGKKEVKQASSNPVFEMIAHRGFNNQFPEDTIYAAKEAIKLGANPESDVQFTADGMMVVIHDDTVDRTTDGKGTVSQLEYSYIEKLDAGKKFNSELKDIRIPKFTDYLEAVKSAKHIYPELKTFRKDEDITTFTKAIIDNGFEQKATIQSFQYPKTLPYIRKVSEKIRVGALCSDQSTFDYNLEIAKKDTNSMMLISSRIATAENLAKCKANKIEVAVWTIDNESQLKSLTDLGYDKLMLSKYMELKK